MSEQLAVTLTALGITLSPVLLKFAQVEPSAVPGVEISADERVMCIRTDNAPIHERFKGVNDIKARLGADDVVQLVEERETWRFIAFVSDDRADVGWIIESRLKECPEEVLATDPTDEDTDDGFAEGAPFVGPNAHTWAPGWIAVDRSLAPTDVVTFSTTKGRLEGIYQDHRISLYCGCDYGTDKEADFASCGYEPRSPNGKSKIEWEHMVPASRFGSFRECWTDGVEPCSTHGRKCCERTGTDPDFFTMVSDMHNLAPAIGEVNLKRSNFPYGETDTEHDYGQCDFNFDGDTVQPRAEVRGDVARATLYMHRVYGMPLSDDELALFRQWNADDPVDEWERERDGRIAEVQGNHNPFVQGE